MMPREDGAERFHVSDSLAKIAKQIEKTNDEEAVVRPRTQVAHSPGIEHEAFVEVEWVGEPSFIRNPVVALRLALVGQDKGFTPHQAAVIRAANRIRSGAFPGVTRSVGPRSGFSRHYTWGHKNQKTSIQRMTMADADKLKASRDGHEFRIIGVESPPALLTLPDVGLRMVSDKEFKRVEGYMADERARPKRDW